MFAAIICICQRGIQRSQDTAPSLKMQIHSYLFQTLDSG